MKQYIMILVLCICTFAHAQSDVRMELALKCCQEGNYEEAIGIYEGVLNEGQESSTLYYNLGYAYFKSGMLGKSILNFERAKRLSPFDADITFNLEQAYSQTDKLQTLEPVFFVRWWNSFCNTMGSDGWAILFVVLFCAVLLCVGFFLFSDIVALRKFGFFAAIVLLMVCILSLCISLDKRSEQIDGSAAIIMSASVTLSTSPDVNGSEMAVLHEGTYVDIIGDLGEWIEVRLKDGNVGWLKKSDVEVI